MALAAELARLEDELAEQKQSLRRIVFGTIAVEPPPQRPDHLLIDGNRFKPHSIPHTCEIKGDGRFVSIAAASILAKTHRDGLMNQLALEHPDYGWETNMGYPTKAHKSAIQIVGHCSHHRKTFRGVQGSLFSD